MLYFLPPTDANLIYQVRDELENLLDDDDDMAEMYLTDKSQQQLDGSFKSSVLVQDGTDEDVCAEMDDRHVETSVLRYQYTVYLY